MKNIFTITFCLITMKAFSQFSGGTGTTINPYQISNKADLKTLSENSVHWNKHFIQTANISFHANDYIAGGNFYNGGSGFIPIGNGSNYFTGYYDGQGFFIDSLYVSRGSEVSVGLFGYTSFDTIVNLGIRNSNIIGGDIVGSLVGAHNDGFISNCYSSGIVTGNGDVGGLVGGNYGNTVLSTITNSFSSCTVNGSLHVGGLIGDDVNGIINNCYSSGTITGSLNYAGGLIGRSESNISNSYSTSTVTGNTIVGGFVGYNYGSISNSYCTGSINANDEAGGFTCGNNLSINNCYTISSVNCSGLTVDGFVPYNNIETNCFYNIDVYSTSVSATGLNTSQMQTQSNFTVAGWDFTNVWQMGACNEDGDYPILKWQNPITIGDGSFANPYQISSKEALKYLSDNSCYWDKQFIQTANIDFNMSDYAPGGNFYYGGSGFKTIGNVDTAFFGSYNGQGFVVDSLFINRPSEYYVGFFGYSDNANLSNIHLTNVNISAESNMGALIGFVDNTNISNCTSSGLLNASNGSVGGLIGVTQYSTVTGCHASCTVTASNSCGGFIGNNNLSSISNCSSNSDVTGNSITGGFAGYNAGTIITSYASGTVNGSFSTGGFVGWSYSDSISNSYSNVLVNGIDRVGGFAGTSETGNITNSYSSGNVVGSSNSGGFVGYDYLGVYDNDFWNTETSGLASTAGTAAGISSLLMQTQTTFTDSTWDFIVETTNGIADIWKMGNCETNNGFPILYWQNLNPLPTAPVINATGNITFCNGGSVTINSSTGDNYMWSTGDTTNSIMVTNSDTVYVITESNQGCISDTSNLIIVSEIDCSGIEELENTITVYPNPTSDFILVNTNGIIENIKLYDALGKMVGNYYNQNIINVSELNNGIYLIEVNIEGQRHIQRIIKK